MGRLARVGELVFGQDRSDLRNSLLAQLADAPETIDIVIAMAGDEAVCAARTEFLPGTEFAGLWGGGTLPQWRRRGIYRALVRYRAELAAAARLQLPDGRRLGPEQADPGADRIRVPGRDDPV